MSIRALSLDEFNALHAPRSPVFRTIVEEREWYANDRATVLGIIICYLPQKEWAIVVLTRHVSGGPFVPDLTETRVGTIEEARARLIDVMHARSSETTRADG
jgi:hypothetical protein